MDFLIRVFCVVGLFIYQVINCAAFVSRVWLCPNYKLFNTLYVLSRTMIA